MALQTKGMASIVPLPSINPEHTPRKQHHDLPVPVVPLPKIPQSTPKVAPTHADGKAPKTRIPMGFTRPILTAPHHVDLAHRG
jgi:hypothetical protein